MQRRFFACIIALLLVVGFLSACGDDKDRLDDLNQDTKQAEQALAEAQSNLDRINELRGQYQEIQGELAKAEMGTSEYDRLVEKNNRLVNQIVKEFPEMADYVETR